ncbi:MAG: hypothetical protein KJ077_10655 [Anaerolineae bacterium]|nr:hypothetical protein [Anaerolineae bacterium]
MNQRDKLKLFKPYFLILHPQTGKTAVYNRKYEKMFEAASAELIGYAVKHNTQVAPGFGLTKPEQQPSWISEEIKEQCIGYHLYSDTSTTPQIKKIPES